MVFNFSNNYQFTPKLNLKGESLEVIEKTKLLGTIFTNDLKWDENTADLVRRANGRMQMLRKAASFGASVEDLKEIYVLFIRSILEQSAVVWHSSLTVENIESLERVQKSAVRIILGRSSINYEESLIKLGMEYLESRRDSLCLGFAQKCVKNPKLSHLFPENKSNHKMKLRKSEKYFVQFSHTERLQRSPIIHMQNLLNEDERKLKEWRIRN